MSEPIEPSRFTTLAPLRSTSGQNSLTENRGAIDADARSRTEDRIVWATMFRWYIGSGLQLTSSAVRPVHSR